MIIGLNHNGDRCFPESFSDSEEGRLSKRSLRHAKYTWLGLLEAKSGKDLYNYDNGKRPDMKRASLILYIDIIRQMIFARLIWNRRRASLTC